MPYLNVQETNSLMELLTLQFPLRCERITLPFESFEGRTSFALRIRVGPVQRRPGVLLIGSVHGNEWGSTDILMFLAEKLLETEPGLLFDFFDVGSSISADPIFEALAKLDVFIFPVVNPDGKRYSQTEDQGWRKNRAPTPDPEQIGVDVNRNFDWIWDYRRYYRDPPSGVAVSDDPSEIIYHGTAPFSEAESRNVLSLLSGFPHIRFFVDVHCFSGLLMHPWGDDDTQTNDFKMNFTNPEYDGLRGDLGDTAYREYMSPGDLDIHQTLVSRMGTGLTAFRGSVYTEGPIGETMYLVSGTSTDYAFSRHLAQRRRNKIHSFLIEWGLADTFHPPFSEMQLIIREVAAGLIELLTAAADMPLIEKSPDPVLFGNVPIGESRVRMVVVRNVSNRPVELSNVTVAGAGYQLGSVTDTNLAVDETAIMTVILQPQQEGSAPGALRFRARHDNGNIADRVEVQLQGGSCTAGKGECRAPLVAAHSATACALIRAQCALLIAFYSLFGSGEKARCAIARLRFRMEHCREGNGDPCIPL